MRRIFLTLFVSAIVSGLVFSCARRDEQSFEEVEARALAEWINQNAPSAKPIGNGIYMQLLDAGESGASLIEDNDWVKLNYTGTDLYGNCYISRSEDVAKVQGTYSVYTHYAPDYQTMSMAYSTLVLGQYHALKLMKKGAKAIIYVPSTQAYGSYGYSASDGYNGQFSLAGNKPVIMTLEVVDVAKDPVKYEEGLVMGYAVDVMGMAVKDSVGKILYYQELSVLPDADGITVDSTVTLYYKGYFLDGFVFDTNIDSVGQRVYKDNTLTYQAISYKPSTGNLVQAFKTVVPKVTYGSWTRMVFTSSFGYGASGSTSGNTAIPGYTPLAFDFYIMPYGED